MNALYRRSTVSLLFLPALALVGCNKQPAADVTVKPATEATAGPFAPKETVAIFFAQVGNRLGENNLLAESLAEVKQGDDVYAMAVFKGPAGDKATAGIKVTSESGEEVFSESKEFAPNGGEVPVVFAVKPGEALAPGSYKALFTLGGVPCWEVAFKVT